MAKLTLNSALAGISGRIDAWVYRRFGDQMVLSRRPELTAPPSAAQLAVREKFAASAAYVRAALADPVLRPLYMAAANAKGVRLFAFAMGDYLNPPQVKVIDTTGYHGQIGDLVRVDARDEFKIVTVKVVIRNQAAAVLEQGLAVFMDGQWAYATQVVVAAGQHVTIEATATDRPGHSHSLAKPVVIA